MHIHKCMVVLHIYLAPGWQWQGYATALADDWQWLFKKFLGLKTHCSKYCIWVSNEGSKSQMTFWKVSFESQRRIWTSNEAPESQMTFQKVSFESQSRDLKSQTTFWKLSFETQMRDLNLRWHFEKCHLSLRGGISISNDILKSTIWDSNEGSKPQMTFWRVSFETQMKNLNLRWHFEQCHLSLKWRIWISDDILKSVIWVSK